MRRVVLTLLAAVVLWAAGPRAEVEAQETVRVRAGDHDDFGRLVFDWSTPVRYRAYVQNDQLHLEFARRAAFQLGQVFPTLRAYLGQAAPGPHGYRLTFPLKGDFILEHFTSGPKVVVDLKQPGSPPESAPAVRMRAGRHEVFDRLVFDWRAPVAYSVERAPDGEKATVRFERPARLDISAFSRERLPRVGGVRTISTGTGSGVAVDIPPEARLRHFTIGPKVVVDVMAPGAETETATAGSGAGASSREGVAPDAAANDGADSTASAGRRAARSADAQGGTDASESPDAPEPDDAPARPPAKPEKPARAAAGDDASSRQAASSEEAADSGGGEVESPGSDGDAGGDVREPLSLLPDAREAMARAGQGSAADASPAARGGSDGDGGGEAGDAGEARPAVVERRAVAGASRYPPQKVARGIAPRPGEVPPGVERSDIPLPWAGERVATYRRGGAIWLVAEGEAPEAFTLALVNTDPAVVDGSQEVRDGSTVVRLQARPGLHVRALRDGGRWLLSLAAQSLLPARPMDVRVEDGRVVIPVDSPGAVVDLADPGGGGRLRVVPLAGVGQGVPLRRDFPEFTLLRTVQGIAVVPKAEHVGVRAGDAGIVIHGGDRDLAVSADNGGGPLQASPDAVDGRRLLDPKAWRRADEPYSKARRRLQQAVTEAPPARKPLARLKLARFYFAHGLAAETLGALENYAEDAPRRAEDPQVRLMAGAAHVLQGEWRKAGDALAHPALDGVPDALPWRAAHAAATGADEAAVSAFHRSENLVAAYPDAVRRRLHLAIAEARLRLGDTKAAQHNLDRARELAANPADAAQVDYLEARRLLADEEVEAAEELWRKVADSDHAAARARARFVMIERDLAADRIDRAEAIARLERLRFAWRGDAFEAVLLHRLADLYVAGGRYRRALTVLRQAAAHLPQTAWAQSATDRMREIFKDVFLDGEADEMPPLKALALYESFRELTPAGEAGDKMIAKLVDRLVDVDLLERAAELLDGQVRHRLSGLDRARAGARLASIYLLDDRPAKALDALDISDGTAGSKALTDRRRRLRARALAESDRAKEALALLQGDDSTDGMRLKADIHADAGDWSKAADALAGLLPPVPGEGRALAPGEVQQVLRSAVALTLAGRRNDLDRLDERYGPAMAESKHAETFRLLAGDEAEGEGISTIAQRLAEVSQAKAFMNTFRDTLQQQSSLDGDAG